MTASYPAGIKTFTNKVDYTDAVIASDVNSAYDEITALETALGVTPTTSSTWSGTANYTSGTNYSSVSARIANIEFGVKSLYDARVSIGGTSILTSSTTVGLTFQTSGTGNLVNFNNTSGTTVTSITKDGWISAIDGGTA